LDIPINSDARVRVFTYNLLQRIGLGIFSNIFDYRSLSLLIGNNFPPYFRFILQYFSGLLLCAKKYLRD
jgi:hypothetical protein